MTRQRSMVLAVSLVGLVLVGGCTSPEHARGWVPALQNGETAADFTYVDVNGVEHPFQSLLGDFTVLAFTRCDRDMHRPTARVLEDIVRENDMAHDVVVSGVDVHWSDGGCRRHSHCHVISEGANLASLCDATGAVRREYGINKGSGLYLLDAKGKVLASASQGDAKTLREELHARVQDLEHRKELERAQRH